jgi:hypothetical protein
LDNTSNDDEFLALLLVVIEPEGNIATRGIFITIQCLLLVTMVAVPSAFIE